MSDAASSSGRSTEILIVDDDGTVCRSIEKVLNRAGYKTRTCLSVSAALETVQAKPEFDLIITDLMMPRANGVELLKIAKATWPKIPVLVITGYASLASAVEATQLGAAHYLAKPFTPDELLAAVERAFAPQPFTETMSAPAVAQQDGEPAESIELEPNGPDDLTGAAPGTAVLVVDDEVIVANSVRKILTRRGYRVEAAFTGAEALRRVEKDTYGLVLLDTRLPDMNGLELVSRIKNMRPDLPILVVTGYASIESAVEAVRRGAADYMAKPFTPKELSQLVSRTLGRRRE